MSGPKTSRYTLTPEQRRILAEQRKIERRKAVATETIKKAQKRLIQIGGMFTVEKQIASELFSRTGKHRLTRAHREKQLKMSCQALHNAPPNRT